jgi:hypothetical protein
MRLGSKGDGFCPLELPYSVWDNNRISTGVKKMRLDSKRDGVCPLELPSLAQFGVMAGFLWRIFTGVETMRLNSKKTESVYLKHSIQFRITVGFPRGKVLK